MLEEQTRTRKSDGYEVYPIKKLAGIEFSLCPHPNGAKTHRVSGTVAIPSLVPTERTQPSIAVAVWQKRCRALTTHALAASSFTSGARRHGLDMNMTKCSRPVPTPTCAQPMSSFQASTASIACAKHTATQLFVVPTYAQRHRRTSRLASQLPRARAERTGSDHARIRSSRFLDSVLTFCVTATLSDRSLRGKIEEPARIACRGWLSEPAEKGD